MSTFLSAAEVRELTGRRRSDAQARALEHMGVPYSTRPDGSLVVLRVVAERLLGGNGTMPKAEPELMP